MRRSISPKLRAAQDRLQAITVRWAAHRELDAHRAADIRREAIELAHEHYFATIPHYRKVCERMRVTGPTSFEIIVDRLLVPDDIFKSYPDRLLDEHRFDDMNAWLSRISAHEIRFDTSSITSIDAWLAKVEEHGLRLVFSSGTSGHVSFVPRDEATWAAFTRLPFLYVAAALGHRGQLSTWKFVLLKLLADRLSAATYAELVQRYGLRSAHGFLLNFAGGNQGVQLVGQEVAKVTASAHFLYERKMSAEAIRAIVRGPKTPSEQRVVREFLATTVDDKEANYDRLLDRLQRSVAAKHRVVLFGTPALMLEVCEMIEARGLDLPLAPGSTVSYGGGWKSFTGQRIPEAALVRKLARTFRIAPGAISEGYSMTEINGLMQKCTEGVFHAPPFLELVIYDEGLEPIEGDVVQGTLGVLDPFATSYPGFVLTGDNVRLSRLTCGCGLPGPTISHVDRSPGKDVKGCGGIMATVNA